MGLDDKSPPPQTFDELAERLRGLMPRLSAAHRQLAQRILSDPEGTAFQSIKDLAELVGVNQSTVVRFAQAAGLPGFPALRRLCEQHLTRQAQLVRRFDQLAELEATSREFLEHTAQLDRHNISRTFARVDMGMWDAIVAKISQARAVHVIGLRKSFAPAYLLWYLLQLTREDVFTVTPATGTLVDQLRRIGPGDVCLAISIHRYAHDTVAALALARDAGATTVALTDNPASPLAGLAYWTLLVDTTGAGVLRSMTAFIAIVQALAGAVAAHRGAKSRDALVIEEELLQRFNVYAQELSPPGQAAAAAPPPAPTGPAR
jgi:DNA-binding MurR/RpiR family transcriptional regulator